MNTSLGFWRNPIVHGILSIIVIAIPFLVLQFPAIANLTIGGVAMMLVEYLKNKSLVAGIRAGSIRV